MAKINLTFKEYKDIKTENLNQQNIKGKDEEIKQLKFDIAKELNGGNVVGKKKLKNYVERPDFIEKFELKAKEIEERYSKTATSFSKEEYEKTLEILQKTFKDFKKVDKNLLYAFISDDDKIKEKYLLNIVDENYVSTFFAKHYNELYVPILKDIKKEIITYFTKELDTDYIQKTKHYYGEERLYETDEELNIYNFDEFIDVYFNFDDEFNLDLFLENSFIGIECMFDEYFFENDEIMIFLQECAMFEEIFDDTIRESIIDTIAMTNDYYDLYSEVCNYFNREKVEELILKNKNYKFIKKQREEIKEKERKIENALNEMPESFFDYFPLARTKKRKFTLHIGPTNSGKTYMSLQEFKKFKNGIYLGPLRLLAFEQYEKLNNEGIKCNLVTGEELITI